MCSASDPLAEFINLIPSNDRHLISSTVMKLRSLLSEQIDSNSSISGPLGLIKRLKPVFLRTPISLRRSLRMKIFTALEQCINSSEASAVLTVLLSIIETNTLRNSDRCDLERDDILEHISDLNLIVAKLIDILKSQRINLLSLRAWIIAMLVHTYRQCVIWCYHQDCINFNDNSLEDIVPLDPEMYTSPCVPKLLKVALECQVNNLPPPIPNGDYLLNDLLLLSAFSDGTIKLVRQHNRDKVYNRLENDLDYCSSLKPVAHLEIPATRKFLPTMEEVRESLTSLDLLKVRKHLELIGRHILDNVPPQDDLKVLCKELIQGAPAIMLSASSKLDENANITEDCKSLYSSIFCGFLRVWIYALERRLIFEDMSQSYLYLCAFTNIRFQVIAFYLQTWCIFVH